MTKMSVGGARFESMCDRKERAREGKSNTRVDQQGFLGTYTHNNHATAVIPSASTS